eukprot:TRINITY_DN1826_c0_g2_i1.p1 TRINITY_DN1826_c0_g2~~TRINITY_DN1826_c0_g2_i1.p1  ORF type:complete len:267 (+),score=41.41 TRINITY_DN1826_c0_g2_i1:138-938(+)
MKSLSDWKKYLHSQTEDFIRDQHRARPDSGAFCISFTSKLSEVVDEEERKKLVEFMEQTFNVSLQKAELAVNLEDLYLQILDELNVTPRFRDPFGDSSRRYSPFSPRARATHSEISTILPAHLYLSSSFGAAEGSMLKQLNIRYVINCAAECRNIFPTEFNYFNLSLRDDEQECITDTFLSCFDIIEKAKREGCGVLVHCYAGVSRSATIIIGYLMKYHKLRFKEAFYFTQTRRPIISPNNSYQKQLNEFENSIFGEPSGETLCCS